MSRSAAHCFSPLLHHAGKREKKLHHLSPVYGILFQGMWILVFFGPVGTSLPSAPSFKLTQLCVLTFMSPVCVSCSHMAVYSLFKMSFWQNHMDPLGGSKAKLSCGPFLIPFAWQHRLKTKVLLCRNTILPKDCGSVGFSILQIKGKNKKDSLVFGRKRTMVRKK